MNKLKREKLQSIDLGQFTHVKSKVINRDFNGKMHQGLTIVKAPTSKRIILNNTKILDALLQPKTVQIAYSDNEVILASYIQNDSSNYTVRKSGKNGVIYNSELINLLIDHFNLDYSERTSITFPVSTVEHNSHGPVVVINMKCVDDEIDKESIESEGMSEESAKSDYSG